MIHKMELILISPSKLKVMLTQSDMEQYSLKTDRIDYDNTETRRAFWSILDEAKHQTGFDAASDKVFIQIYPSRNGGCEMYVTKLPQKGDCEENDDIFCHVSAFEAQPVFFSFDNMQNLIDACRALKNRGFSSESQAFFSLENPARYYLSVTSSNFEQLYEYGCKIKKRFIPSYILERCKCICDSDAVGMLADLWRKAQQNHIWQKNLKMGEADWQKGQRVLPYTNIFSISDHNSCHKFKKRWGLLKNHRPCRFFAPSFCNIKKLKRIYQNKENKYFIVKILFTKYLRCDIIH